MGAPVISMNHNSKFSCYSEITAPLNKLIEKLSKFFPENILVMVTVVKTHISSCLVMMNVKIQLFNYFLAMAILIMVALKMFKSRKNRFLLWRHRYEENLRIKNSDKKKFAIMLSPHRQQQTRGKWGIGQCQKNRRKIRYSNRYTKSSISSADY